MSLPISSLTAIAKTSIGATHYLPLADGTAANYKLLIQDLFPAMNTLGATSEALFVSVTNKNTLNFKGIKSLNSLLTVATASNNITLQVNEASINLANCNNATSQFLTGPINLASLVTGTLPVANGGTGLATLTANSLFVGNGTSALTALGVATNGQIPIGRTGLSPVLANLTPGTNVTITNGVGSITVAATLAILTQNLNGAGWNIYGLGWLSGDGQNEGLTVNAAGQVFVGSSTPTAFFNYDFNINNSLGFNGSVANQFIAMSSSATPGWLHIDGSDANAANINGGIVSIDGGSASGTGGGGPLLFQAGSVTSGSGTGGLAYLKGGNADSGIGGLVTLSGGASTSGTGGGVTITSGAGATSGGAVNMSGSAGAAGGTITVQAGTGTSAAGGSLTLTAGASLGAGTAGSVNITPGKSTSGTDGKVVINVPSGSTTAPLVNFTGIEGAASANSFSNSTASAGNKIGAIKVQINGVDKWIRVYDSAI